MESLTVTSSVTTMVRLGAVVVPRLPMMVELLLMSLLLLTASTASQQTPPKNETVPKIPPPLGPTPPRQTPVMAAQMAQVAAAAAVASAAAKPRLLKLLAEPGFTAAINECCPELVAMTPQQRLNWFDAESAAAEMVHNFGRSEGNDAVAAAVVDGDESIELGSASKYFHNLWEIELLTAEQGPVPDAFGPPPPPKLHVDCTNYVSVHSCENASRATQLQLRNQPMACKWRTASSECVPIPKEQSGAQVTDIVEVGLFGFPAFAEKNASSDGARETRAPFRSEISQDRLRTHMEKAENTGVFCIILQARRLTTHSRSRSTDPSTPRSTTGRWMWGTQSLVIPLPSSRLVTCET